MFSNQLHKDLLDSAPDAMIIVNADNKIEMINLEAERIFGYCRDELVGNPLDILIPERYHHSHQGHVAGYCKMPIRRPMGSSLDLFARKKNGVEFPVEISLGPLNSPDGLLVSATVRDVTERKSFEEKIKNALQEKETLLKEIHHRVKNNLAIVSGFLGLQLDSIEDEKTQYALEQTQNRIFTMSLIHQKLYQSSNLSTVNARDFLISLSEHLCRSYDSGESEVSLNCDVDEIEMKLDHAIPCGLIVNELVTNAIKYGLPKVGEGKVDVGLLKLTDNQICLYVRDNGAGFPKGFDVETSDSLGVSLVKNLTLQLEGSVSFGSPKRGEGTEVKVYFPTN